MVSSSSYGSGRASSQAVHQAAASANARFTCTFGLDKWLENLADVREAPFTIFDPIARSTLLAWERRNDFTLPDDLRNFYLSTDGINLRWYCHDGGDCVAGQIRERG